MLDGLCCRRDSTQRCYKPRRGCNYSQAGAVHFRVHGASPQWRLFLYERMCNKLVHAHPIAAAHFRVHFTFYTIQEVLECEMSMAIWRRVV